LPVSTENLAEMLEVNPNTIANWELNLGLNIKTDDSGLENYSDDLINLFKEIKGLILNGYSFKEIKKFLAVDIEYQNQITKSIKEIIVEDGGNTNEDVANPKDTVSAVNEYNSPKEKNSFIYSNLNTIQEYIPSISGNINLFKEPLLDNNLNQPQSDVFFKALLKEIRQYSDRALEAEKKLQLLENSIPNIDQEPLGIESKTDSKFGPDILLEIDSEVMQLKTELEEKDKMMKDFEIQKKRLNLLEVQLKILQLEKSKKKSWEFWK